MSKSNRDEEMPRKIIYENDEYELTKYKGIYVSKNGNAISILTIGGQGSWDLNKIRSANIKQDKDGYLELLISKGSSPTGKRIYKRLHIVIYEHFTNTICDETIDHIDENKKNNSIYNLQKVTRVENVKLYWERRKCNDY